jgi:hypothetical protein
LNRSIQTRRDDDIIKSPQRTIYDIDYAIKWFIENEIQPQITEKQLIPVPVIFAMVKNGITYADWDICAMKKECYNLQLIVLKRNNVTERDNQKSLDVNRPSILRITLYHKQI